MQYPREGLHLGVALAYLYKIATGLPTILIVCAILAARESYSHSSPRPFDTLPSRTKCLTFVAFAICARLLDHVNSRSINGWQASHRAHFNNEIVVITGGSSGIGESAVRQILSEAPSATMVIVDIEAPTYSVPSNVRFFRCDLSRPEDLISTVRQIQREVGDPTILVNNAGLSRGRLMSDLEFPDISITLSVNLIAPMLLIRHFLPAMIARQHGHILNIASLSALVPPAGLADYAASKAGLLAMSESLRMELRHVHKANQVRVSSLILSFVKTPLFKGKTNQSEFIMPLLHVDTVGEEILGILRSGSSAIRTMPTIAGILGSLNALPRFIQDVVLNGTAKLAVDFKGRQVVDEKGHILSKADTDVNSVK